MKTNIPEFKSTRIETTNLCGCYCFMCPIGQMTRKKGRMQLKKQEVSSVGG